MYDWFEPLFASGRIIDWIVLMVAAEAALLAWLGRHSGRASLFADVAPTLVSGALLLLTVRAALSGAWWGWIALILTLALLSHGVDLLLRWRKAGRHDPNNDSWPNNRS
jgi:hypothetical protein